MTCTEEVVGIDPPPARLRCRQACHPVRGGEGQLVERRGRAENAQPEGTRQLGQMECDDTVVLADNCDDLLSRELVAGCGRLIRLARRVAQQRLHTPPVDATGPVDVIDATHQVRRADGGRPVRSPGA